MSTAPGATGDVVTQAIRLLAEQGYHATTVDQLAQAAGVSRATFFRKYGSKEDIVFADHASNLERLQQLLNRPNLTPQSGLAEGVQLVFRHNLDYADRAIARHHLLQDVGSLRDRELATSHRYERLFQGFLRGALPESGDRCVTAVSLAAATVAVHNAYLRTWLRNPRITTGEQLAAGLNQRIGWLCTAFGLSPGVGHLAGAPRHPEAAAPVSPVIVVLPEGADPREAAEQTARSVYETLVTARGQPTARPETNTA